MNGAGNGIERIILEGRNRVVALSTCTRSKPTRSGNMTARVRSVFFEGSMYPVFGTPTGAGEPILKGVHRDYYDPWLRLLSRDAWLEEGEFARVLDGRTLEERIEQGITFPILDISLTVMSEAPQSMSTNDCETVRRPGQAVANVAFQDSVADVGPGEESSHSQRGPMQPCRDTWSCD